MLEVGGGGGGGGAPNAPVLDCLCYAWFKKLITVLYKIPVVHNSNYLTSLKALS